MGSEITKFDDIIDSRAVIERIEELEAEEEAAQEEGAEPMDSDAKTELAALRAFAADAEPYCPDWRHGATLIHREHFEDYAQELAEDIGAIDRDAKWPLRHIDWTAAAEELKGDYTSVDFDGQEYLVR